MNRQDAIKALIASTQQLNDALRPFETDANQAPVVAIAKAITDIEAAITTLIAEARP